MSERLSPLTQRVRRLLGTGSLAPPTLPISHERGSEIAPLPHSQHHQPHRPTSDSAALFETRIASLSHLLEELRSVDRQREAELRAMREQISDAHEQARLDLLRSLEQALAELDDALRISRTLLTPPEQLPATTLYERMRARIAAGQRPDSRQHELTRALLITLSGVRERLRQIVGTE